MLGHDPLGDDPLLAVHVLEERVQGTDPLAETECELVPLRPGEDPGHRVDGERVSERVSVLAAECDTALVDEVADPVAERPEVGAGELVEHLAPGS